MIQQLLKYKNAPRTLIRISVWVLLLFFIALVQYQLANSESFLQYYIQRVFLPLQVFRSKMLNFTGISFGDYLYLLLSAILITIVVRLVYFLISYKSNKAYILNELFRLFNFLTLIYFFFLVFWGGNYARPSLSKQYLSGSLPEWNTDMLLDLTNGLVEKMNEEVQYPLPFTDLKQTNAAANDLYHNQFQCKLPHFKVKPTSVGYLLHYVGIQGYYNPLSGEAQLNKSIPKFMHPFVVCHEMAHQAGIAAEDDANLLAYLLCAQSKEATFRYSAFFNLFLYAYSDLKERDSVSAAIVLNGLNDTSKAHLKELKEMRLRYKSRFRKYTIGLYDGYLRFQGQRDGIKSYGGVTQWAYLFQQSGKGVSDISVCGD